MPVSMKKTILFARAAEGKVTHLWPVAVFNERKTAASYASFLKMAHSTGSAEAIKLLDPAAKLGEDGTPLPVEKFSLVEVPYAPQPALAEFDEPSTPEPATA